MSEEVTSVIVRMKHVRAARLCSGGTRGWWRDHGLDWSDFLANGIPAERLAATGDPLALRAVAAAEADSEQ